MAPPMASIGRKRRFLLFGALNVALTNLLLQLLLWCGVATGLATLLSQLLNLGLGYLLYGMHVFRVASLQGRSALAYAALALLLWGLNWGGINGLAGLGWPRHWAALALVPLLAAISYRLQRQWVFPEPAAAAALHLRP